jgi:hypothetical protein
MMMVIRMMIMFRTHLNHASGRSELRGSARRIDAPQSRRSAKPTHRQVT